MSYYLIIFKFLENMMDRIEYYDRLVKRVVVYGVGAGFLVMTAIGTFLIN